MCLACGGQEQCADCVRLLAFYVADRVRPERVEVAGWVEPMLSFEWGGDGTAGEVDPCRAASDGAADELRRLRRPLRVAAGHSVL